MAKNKKNNEKTEEELNSIKEELEALIESETVENTRDAAEAWLQENHKLSLSDIYPDSDEKKAEEETEEEAEEETEEETEEEKIEREKREAEEEAEREKREAEEKEKDRKQRQKEAKENLSRAKNEAPGLAKTVLSLSSKSKKVLMDSVSSYLKNSESPKDLIFSILLKVGTLLIEEDLVDDAKLTPDFLASTILDVPGPKFNSLHDALMSYAKNDTYGEELVFGFMSKVQMILEELEED